MGKRTMKNKKISTKYGDRFLGIYFKELNEDEFDKFKARTDYVHEKNKEIVQKYDTNVLDKLDSFMTQLDSLQSNKGEGVVTEENE